MKYRFNTPNEAVEFLSAKYGFSSQEAVFVVFEEGYSIPKDNGIWLNTYRFVTRP